MPDNCKTAVKHASLYNPELNHAYRNLALHYGVAVIPARIVKPRDYRRKSVIGNLILKSDIYGRVQDEQL